MNLLELRQHIDSLHEEAIEEWLQENPPETIKAAVKEQLNSVRSKILLATIGFQIEGRRVYFPHHWPRDGVPYATQVLLDVTQDTVKTFIEKHAHELLPSLEKKALEDFAQRFRSEFFRTLESESRRKATEMATEARTKAIELIDVELDAPREEKKR